MFSVFAERNDAVDHEAHLQGIPKVLEIDFKFQMNKMALKGYKARISTKM